MIYAILATDEQGAIGYQNRLPWGSIAEDMKWFQLMTVGHIVVMGRGTWDSADMKRPLPKRENWVVTSTVGPELEGARAWNGDPLALCKKLEKENPNKIIWVIGGARIIESMQGSFDRIYLSSIVGSWPADTFVDLKKLTEGYEEIYNNRNFTGIGVRIYERIS